MQFISQTNYPRVTAAGLGVGPAITISTQLILQAAEKLGITYSFIADSPLIALHFQGVTKYFRYQISSETTDVGFAACDDKGITSSLLRAAGISTPKGLRLSLDDTPTTLETSFQSLQKPLVVKPTHGNKGNAISTQITDYPSFVSAFNKAGSLLNIPNAGVIVEETVQGEEYRVLATRTEILGIVYRRPANVEGDGVHTIQELIDIKNLDPARGDDTFPLAPILIDADIHQHLHAQAITLQTVPEKGKRIMLRSVSNVSKGGDPLDMTDIAHPSVHQICLKAINAIPGLAFAGIDFMTTDITALQTESSYAIIEINSSPGFCIHEFPFQGKPRGAQFSFLKLAFPQIDIQPFLQDRDHT